MLKGITPASLGRMIAEALEELENDPELRSVIEELLGLDEDAGMDDLNLALEALEEWQRDY